MTLGVLGRMSDEDDPRYVPDVPGVFWYVADPFGAGIAESVEGTGRPRIAGTFNRVPEEVNIRAIRSVRPDFDHLGILYNANERNSVIKVEEHESLSQAMGYAFTALEIEPGTPRAPDPVLIPVRMKKWVAAGIDFVYLGSSSYLRIHGEAFTRAAVDNGIPVLSPYEELEREQDALISMLREGVSPGDLPIKRVTDFAHVVNMDVARRLNIFPPVEMLQVAETIN